MLHLPRRGTAVELFERTPSIARAIIVGATRIANTGSPSGRNFAYGFRGWRVVDIDAAY
jgi:hypothetical protein